jgi:hypothetical protein
LYYSYIKVLIHASVHSEPGKGIKCDFKPGSVERSIDLYQKRLYLSAVQQQATLSTSATNKN